MMFDRRLPTFAPESHLRSLLAACLLLLALVGRASAQSECDDATGDCLVAHEEGGCSDAACCQTVCGLDPFCCNSWDATCASLANATCVGLCGANASGSCFTPHANAACDDADCCNTVCLVDPFCCSGSWDVNCVLIAGFSCSTGGGECGDPQSGDCFEANGTPACDDETCCESVCDVDPRCCDVVWDAICVAVAEAACGGGCEIAPIDGATIESETCDSSSNDPCDNGTAELLAEPGPVAGTFRTGFDDDVFEFDLTPHDLDGDGLVRVRLGVLAALPVSIELGRAECFAEPGLSVDAAPCIDSILEVCVPAEPTWLRVGAIESTALCDGTSYTVNIEVRDTCDDPCGTGGDCLEPRDDAGCGDAECCAAVCKIDPACCEWEWDAACAVRAAETCGGPPPMNDACTDAIDAPLGRTPFRELLSTPDGPAAWCGPDGDAGGDVWFRHQVQCSGTLFIGTCNTADFDTVVEVFRGDCVGGLESIGCVDDSTGCALGTSLVELEDATCGETLIIRVMAAEQPGGNGDLVIDCFGAPCPCPADLDGDGTVGGADLGVLFVEWGPCGKRCPADLDGDGTVGGSDLGLLFAAWGDC